MQFEFLSHDCLHWLETLPLMVNTEHLKPFYFSVISVFDYYEELVLFLESFGCSIIVI